MRQLCPLENLSSISVQILDSAQGTTGNCQPAQANPFAKSIPPHRVSLLEGDVMPTEAVNAWLGGEGETEGLAQGPKAESGHG